MIKITDVPESIVKHFRTALYHKYVVGLAQYEQNFIRDFYKERTGTELRKFNCQSCALKNCTLAAKVYYAELERYNQMMYIANNEPENDLTELYADYTDQPADNNTNEEPTEPITEPVNDEVVEDTTEPNEEPTEPVYASKNPTVKSTKRGRKPKK